MASETILELENSWPATTIGGEPGIVSGSMEVSAIPGGGAILNLAVGAAGASAAECDYVDFMLSPDQVGALARALAGYGDTPGAPVD